jgi:AcrR family transcriptional regulator
MKPGKQIEGSPEALGAERLVQTGRRLFLEHGYGNVSMQQIATHAGMTKGAPYYHFENKTALFVAVSRQVIEDLRDSLLAPFVTDGALADHLRQAMMAVLQTSHGVLSLWISDFLREVDPSTRSTLFQETLGMDDLRQLLTPAFTDAAARGELRNVAPSVASRVFMKLLVMTMDEEGYISMLDWLHDPDIETTTDELVNVFLYGVAGQSD